MMCSEQRRIQNGKSVENWKEQYRYQTARRSHMEYNQNKQKEKYYESQLVDKYAYAKEVSVWNVKQKASHA